MPTYLLKEFKNEGYFETLDRLRAGGARVPQKVDTDTESGAGIAPPGISQDVWNALTDDQRKLWD